MISLNKIYKWATVSESVSVLEKNSAIVLFDLFWCFIATFLGQYQIDIWNIN